MRYLKTILTHNKSGNGYARSVRVIGNKAYVADGEAGICVLDVDGRQAPFFIPTLRQPALVGYAEDLDISGNIICVANGEGGVCVLDLCLGTVLHVDTKNDINANALQVRCDDKYAYVANGGTGLAVMSLQDFSVRYLPIACSDGHRVAALGLATYSGNICITSGYAGICIIDVSDATLNPHRISLPGHSEKMCLVERMAYVASGAFGLHVINLDDTHTYRHFPLPPELSGCAHDVRIQDGKAYVAAGSAGLLAIDILNGKVDSVSISRHVSDAYALSLEIVGNYVYLACGAAGLAIVELNNTSTAHQQGRSLSQSSSYVIPYLRLNEATQPTISETEIGTLRSFLGEDAGFQPNWSADPGFQEQVAYLMRDHGFRGFHDYYRWLRSKEAVCEIHDLLDSWTVFPGWFFKDNSCFRTVEILLNQIVAWCQKSDRTELRLLSVGCSAGEEPYTLAMQLLDNRAKLKGLGIRVLAIDVNSYALDKAEHGCFREQAFRSTPIHTRHLYFKPVSGSERSHQIDLRVRQLVTFRHENLLSPSTETRQFAPDIIFCRNVISYMDQSKQRTAIANLHTMLVDDGYLFLAISERLPSFAAVSFKPGLPGGIMLFQKLSLQKSPSGFD